MSLFENVGRRVERFKQQVTTAADEEARAVCTECETLVYTDRETCPECGSEALRVRHPEDADETEPAEESTE